MTIGPEPFPGEHLLRDLAPQVLGAGMRRFGDFAAAEDAVHEALIVAARQCHPALSRSSAIALTLRAVGGLTTAEIAGAFLVPEATWRSGSAKQRIRSSGVPFRLPTLRQAQGRPEHAGKAIADERAERLGAVLHVLYLIFNEGADGQRAGAELPQYTGGAIERRER